MGWIWSVRCEKFRHDFVARTFTLIAPFQPGLHRVSMGNKTVPKASKQYKMHENMSSGSNGVNRKRSLRKIPTRLRGTKVCINCSISARFAPSFVRRRNGPKCKQTVQNTPKHKVREQWGGLGGFVVKKSDTTSWHELLHYLHQVGPF